ncbi:MAG: hypothetical protein H6744_07740 [Deltaproteobacteria bacterium]|nr:hypothetical protein [Deltaproteobacteria bacterium]
MTPARLCRTPNLAATALLALLVGGCTSFYPIDATDTDASADATVDAPDAQDAPDTEVPETTPDTDATPDADVDGLELPDGDDVDADTEGDADATDAADGDADLVETADGDIEADQPDADDADATDAEADAEADVPVCENPCPTVAQTRCAKLPAGTPIGLEVCTELPNGCLQWKIGDSCPKDLCQGPATCSAGVCGFDTTKMVHCPPSGNPCTDVVCAPQTGLCLFAPRDEGEACDDNDPCTTFTECDADGKCVGPFDPVACECTFDIDCEPKEDGDLCNGTLMCKDNACVVNPATVVSCPELTNQCKQNVCTPDTGLCVTGDRPDGTECDDGDACTQVDSCDAGECSGLDPVVCDLGPCMDTQCAPATGECSGTPVAMCCGNDVLEAGEDCDDGNEEPADGCEPDCKRSTCLKQSIDTATGGLRVPGTGLLTTHMKSTVDFWLLVPTGSAGGTVIARPAAGGGSGPNWRLTAAPNGGGVQLTWVESRSVGGDAQIEGPVVGPEAWHHVAVVRDPSGAPAGISWYLDGAPFALSPVSDMQDLGSAADLWVGAAADGGSVLDAQLDDLRVSTGVRYTGPFAPPLGPVGTDAQTELLFHFDDVLSGVAVDDSGKKHHGAWQGSQLAGDDAFEAKATAPRCDVPYCARAALALVEASTGGISQDSSGLDAAQTFTVEFFIRAGFNPGPAFIVGRDAGTVGLSDWRIELRPGTTGGTYVLAWIEGTSSGADYENVTKTAFAGSTWVHVALVRDFFQGVLLSTRWFVAGKAETPKQVSGPKSLTTSEPLRVGANPGVAAGFIGSIDELRISGAVLYGGDFPVPSRLDVLPTSLALFRFDVGTGSFAYSQAPAPVGPLFMPSVSWDPQGATQLTPCPP